MFSSPHLISLRWSDLDPNFPLRHSSYYDLASQHRLNILSQYGLTLAVMEEEHFAPVLLREECRFYRDIRFSDVVHIRMTIQVVSDDRARWTLLHGFTDDQPQKKADLTIDIAWFDTRRRCLANPLPPPAARLYETIQQEQQP